MECLESQRQIRSMKVISPKRAQVEVSLEEPIAIYSRTVLNELLLKRAVARGAQFCQERVLDFRRRLSSWELKTDQANHSVDYLVGADGVNSLVRKKLSTRFPAEDLMMTFGYRAPQDLGDRIEIRFFPQFLGYAWTFPRPDHVSFGICARLSQHSMAELKVCLHRFLEDNGYISRVSETQDWPVYSALIPSLRPQSLRDNAICGEGWALLGDAAGFADPITCEGIFFALRSGELLAEALLQQEESMYRAWCHDEFSADFVHAAQLFERFYTGRFLGSDFITRMVQTTARSRVLQKIMNSFVAGKLDYRSLRPKLVRQAPAILWQILGSSFA
jgi:flavin-dependent dehydrogenase